MYYNISHYNTAIDVYIQLINTLSDMKFYKIKFCSNTTIFNKRIDYCTYFILTSIALTCKYDNLHYVNPTHYMWLSPRQHDCTTRIDVSKKAYKNIFLRQCLHQMGMVSVRKIIKGINTNSISFL